MANQEKERIVLDTNVLMNLNTEQLEDLIENYDVIVPFIVLQELDDLKVDRNSSKSYKARKSIRFIRNHYNKLDFVQHDTNIIKNDDKIIDVAKKYQSNLATFDICMEVKAKCQGVNVLEIDNENKEYKGYRIVNIDTRKHRDSQWLANIYEKPHINPCKLYVNEYLIIRDVSELIHKNNEDVYKTVDILRWNGTKLVKLNLPPKKVIKPLNDLQACALDLLMNKDIGCKVIFGAAGSGKSILTTKMAIYHLNDKGNYSNIMLVRNPIGAGEEIGFLKGDKMDKVGNFFNTVTQHLDFGEMEAEKLMQTGRLNMEIPFYMKGLDIKNTFIICDEAEDISNSVARLLGTRVSEGSAICFVGDIKQSESKFKNNNGLKTLIQNAKGNKNFGCVELEGDLRSSVSKMFADIF